jgi:hypothetical protein
MRFARLSLFAILLCLVAAQPSAVGAIAGGPIFNAVPPKVDPLAGKYVFCTFDVLGDGPGVGPHVVSIYCRGSYEACLAVYNTYGVGAEPKCRLIEEEPKGIPIPYWP